MKNQLLILIGLFNVLILHAQIINVPADQPTIQAGIDAASDGDTVLVSQGTYYENINFNGKAITLASHYLIDPDSSHIFMTIIDGSQPAHTNNGSVVFFVSGEDSTSILQGFTIQNGTGTYPDIWGDRSGGGIYCVKSGAKIIHNRIINNQIYGLISGAFGGGIYADTCPDRTLILRHNLIEDNAVFTFSYPNIAGGAGGFIMMHTITQNNVFRNNYAEGRARGAGLGVVWCSGIVSNNLCENNHLNVTIPVGWGGGIYVRGPEEGLTISRNIVINNTCTGEYSFGGGIGVYTGDDGVDYIDNNIINGNSADYGGGICIRKATKARITNNIIRQNDAQNIGGGIYFTNTAFGGDHTLPFRGFLNSGSQASPGNKNPSDTMIQIINNTIYENISGEGGGIGNGLYNAGFLAMNNIIYANNGYGSAIYTEHSSGTSYLYNNDIDIYEVVGTWTGEGNFYENPEFRDDDCHLDITSPCINGGIDEIEILDVIYCAPLTDIDGEERPNGGFDIGADEWYPLTGLKDPALLNEGNLHLTFYPNPTKGKSSIKYTLSREQYVRLNLFDLHGREITTLVDKQQIEGNYHVLFDATVLSNGIYYFRLQAGRKVASGKVVVISK